MSFVRTLGAIALIAAVSVCARASAQTGPLIIDGSRSDRGPTATAVAPSTPAPAHPVRAEPGAFRPFVFTGLELQGSTVPLELLEQAAAPFVGKTLDRPQLLRLADAVAAAYAPSGVALYSVLVPDQGFDGGIVRLRVIEGYISDVVVTAKPQRPAPALTQAYAEGLKAERPLSQATLERQLGLIRDIPGARPTVQMHQGSTPGAVQFGVDPNIQRFEASSSLNNRGATLLGKTQVQVDLRANSIVREGDQTSLTVAVPVELARFQYVSVTRREPVGSKGVALLMSAGYLRTKPKISGYDLQGHASTAGATVLIPALRSNKANLYATAGFDALNSDNALFGQRISADRTRVIRAAAVYSTQSPKTSKSLAFSASRGLDGLGARTSEPASSHTAFTKTNAQLALSAQSDRFALRVSGSAQYAFDPLPGSEKLALGGAQFGRAFASAVITGDSGYAASLEAAVLKSPAATSFARSEAYAFVDWGWVSNRSSTAAIRRDRLASTGAGVRLAVRDKTMIELEASKAIAVPLGHRGHAPVRLSLNIRTQL